MSKKKQTSLTQKQIQELKKGNKILRKDIDKARERYNILKDDKKSVETINKHLRKEIRELKEQLGSYQKENNMLYQVIEELNEKIS